MKHACFLFLTICIFGLNTFSQLRDLKNYLTATKTAEFDESRKLINDLSFPGCTQYIFSSFGEITGLLFDTDTKGVKGYKAIFNCKAQSKAGTYIEKRMMAVLFFDKLNKKWRVFDIREPVASCDEFQSAKNNIDVARSQYSWRSVSYWAIMCGKLIEAKGAVETSESRARAINDKDFANPYADILKKIS